MPETIAELSTRLSQARGSSDLSAVDLTRARLNYSEWIREDVGIYRVRFDEAYCASKVSGKTPRAFVDGEGDHIRCHVSKNNQSGTGRLELRLSFSTGGDPKDPDGFDVVTGCLVRY